MEENFDHCFHCMSLLNPDDTYCPSCGFRNLHNIDPSLKINKEDNFKSEKEEIVFFRECFSLFVLFTEFVINVNLLGSIFDLIHFGSVQSNIQLNLVQYISSSYYSLQLILLIIIFIVFNSLIIWLTKDNDKRQAEFIFIILVFSIFLFACFGYVISDCC